MPDSNAPDPKAIQEVLAQHQGSDYVTGWAELWDKCESLPWDRGFPNPALEDTLTERTTTIGGPIGQGTRRKKALVPGCGRGVDVLLLASFGYDAYGLECSPAAVEACKQEEAKNGDRYPVRDVEVGRGKIAFVQGDFFDDGWLGELGLQRNSFDLVYDYTVSMMLMDLFISIRGVLLTSIVLLRVGPVDASAMGPPSCSAPCPVSCRQPDLPRIPQT